MIQTIEIKTLEQAMEILLHQHYNEEIGRIRSDYLYRGMPNSEFTLITSLQHNCGDLQYELEPSILRYFAKYAEKEDPQLMSSVWRQLITGQHHNLPTRLLDWTHSPLVGLHFSCCEADMAMTDKRDGVLWRIDEGEFTKLLPEKYKAALQKDRTDVFSVETLSSVVDNLEQYDADMGAKSIAILEPPSSDQRIINQYSHFTVMPKGVADFEKFLDENTEKTRKLIIKKEIRWQLRDLLDQLNISERTLYPGLDGLSKWIARHYYVTR